MSRPKFEIGQVVVLLDDLATNLRAGSIGTVVQLWTNGSSQLPSAVPGYYQVEFDVGQYGAYPNNIRPATVEETFAKRAEL